MSRSWLEISRARLVHNLHLIRSIIGPSVDIIAVLKADAYGHGMRPASRVLWQEGVRRFAVAFLDEAIELRQSLPKAEILILGGIDAREETACAELNLIPAVVDEQAPLADLRVHLLVDTGMTRLGVNWARCEKLIASLGDRVIGAFSHFASADSDQEFCRLQLQRFEEATRGHALFRHFSNSAGIRLLEGRFEAVRPGLALYGIDPGISLGSLEPIMSWKTRLVSISRVPEGTCVGYNAGFVTRRESLIGVLPVGYADGYSRLLSNRGIVRIRSSLAPVVGYVSMDMITVDLTDLETVQIGDQVTLLEGTPDSPLSASALARNLNTIPWEVLTSIGPRVARIWKD